MYPIHVHVSVMIISGEEHTTIPLNYVHKLQLNNSAGSVIIVMPN